MGMIITTPFLFTPFSLSLFFDTVQFALSCCLWWSEISSKVVLISPEQMEVFNENFNFLSVSHGIYCICYYNVLPWFLQDSTTLKCLSCTSLQHSSRNSHGPQKSVESTLNMYG